MDLDAVWKVHREKGDLRSNPSQNIQLADFRGSSFFGASLLHPL